MSALAEYQQRQEAEKGWHHGIQRHITVGRKKDGLRAVWDIPRGCRISRWMRPERAEQACADAADSWRRGSVTLWIIKTADPKGDS